MNGRNTQVGSNGSEGACTCMTETCGMEHKNGQMALLMVGPPGPNSLTLANGQPGNLIPMI